MYFPQKTNNAVAPHWKLPGPSLDNRLRSVPAYSFVTTAVLLENGVNISSAVETSVPVLASYFGPIVASAVVRPRMDLISSVSEPTLGSRNLDASVPDCSMENESLKQVQQAVWPAS